MLNDNLTLLAYNTHGYAPNNSAGGASPWYNHDLPGAPIGVAAPIAYGTREELPLARTETSTDSWPPSTREGGGSSSPCWHANRGVGPSAGSRALPASAATPSAKACASGGGRT